MTESIECNQPFERVPMCACDPGKGEPPSKLKMLECAMRGGPCRKGKPDIEAIPYEGRVV